MQPLLFAALAAVAIPAFGMFLRYRRALNAARARLAVVDRHVISTRWGRSSAPSGAPATQCSLCIHTKDDQVASHEASKRAAERIPGARFVSLESGGHLMLDQTKTIRDELAAFFAESRERRAEWMAS